MRQSTIYRAMRWLLLAALSAICIPPQAAHGQGTVIMLRFAGAPTGGCSFIMQAINTVNGDFYICNPNGTWFKVTGTTSPGVAAIYGSSGTITTLANPVFTGTISGAAETLSGTLTLSALGGGGNQCLRVTTAGVVQATGSDCGSGGGGGGSPGGVNTNVQFNNAGSFGGDANFTYNPGVAVTVPGGTLGTNGLFIGSGGAGITSNGATSTFLRITAGTSAAPQIQFNGGTSGASNMGNIVLQTTGGFPAFNVSASASLGLECHQTTQIGQGFCIEMGNANSWTASSSGTASIVAIGADIGHGAGGTFAPTSGTANFQPLILAAVINQTGTSSGNYELIHASATETSLKGSANYLIRIQAGVSGTTDTFTVNNTGTTGLAGLRFPANSPDVGFSHPSAGLLYLDSSTVGNIGGSLELFNLVIHGTCTGCGGGGGGGATFQANGVNLLSQTLINNQDSSTISVANPSAGNQQYNLIGASHYLKDNPSASQVVVQPAGTKFSVNNIDNTVTVTDLYRWQQTGISTVLSAGVQATVTLAAGVPGLDVTGSTTMGGPKGGMMVYISDSTLSEAVYVTGGTYTRASGGTIIFTPFNSHAAGYALGSAGSGMQEALNDACGMLTWPTSPLNGRCHVIMPPPASGTNWPIYGTVYVHASNVWLDGPGTSLDCQTRGPCIQIGDQTSAGHWNNNYVTGFKFAPSLDRSSDPAFAGCQITNTQRTSGTITVTTASNCNFRTGDMLSQMFTDRLALRGDIPSITVTDSTHYTYTRSGASDLPSEATPGLSAVNFVAFLDNSTGTAFNNIYINGPVGDFVHFFDYWDDEASEIDNLQMSSGVWTGPNWMGYAIHSGGANNLPSTSQQLAPVITLRASSFTNLNCVYVSNSNGVYIEDSVCQNAISQFNISSVTGNFQSARLQNIYPEASPSVTNPANASPWGGEGVSGLIGGQTSDNYYYSGEMGVSGGFPVIGASGSFYNLISIVAHDTTASQQTAPMPCAFVRQVSLGSVTVSCPRISNGADVITYDVLSQGGLASAILPSTSPTTNNCVGGSPSACGSYLTAQAQCSGLSCSFTFDTSTNTTAYTVGAANFAATPHFWPGGVVLSSNTLQSDRQMFTIGLGFNGGATNIAGDCQTGGTYWGGWTSCSNTSFAPSNSIPAPTAMLLQDGSASGGGMTANIRGRMQFIINSGVTTPAHHIIDLVVATPSDSKAQSNYRPVASVNDVWIGTDNTSAQGITTQPLAFGSPISISGYIGNVGDGTSWKFRQTSTLFSFATPVTILTGNAFTLGGITGSTQCLQVNTSGVVSGTGTACGGAGSTPGGASTNVQYNSSGTFGGNSGFLYDGTSVVTVGPVNGTNDGTIQLKGRTSGTASIATGATGGNLLLNGTSAFVDPSGNLTVVSCTGCGGAAGAWSSLSNAGSSLTLNNAGFASTFNQTSSVAWTWANTTAATVTVPQAAPSHVWGSTYWNGSASATDTITLVPSLVAGTNGAVKLQLSHSGSTGAFSLDLPAGSGTSPSLTFGTAGGGFWQSASNTVSAVNNSATTAFGLYNAATQVATIQRSNTTSAHIIFGPTENAIPLRLILGTGSPTYSITSVPIFSVGGTAAGVADNLTATSGTQSAFAFGSFPYGWNFQPASGTANYIHARFDATINQTGTSSGNYTGLRLGFTETSLKGSDNRLLDFYAGAAGTTNVFAMTNGGLFKIYNSITTAGLAMPVQTGAVNLTGQTAAISATTFTTVGGTTTNYNVKAGIQCTASSASATIQLTITYTDTSSTPQTITSPTADCTTLGANSVVYIDQPVRVKNGTNIQYSTSITNTPNYDVFADAYQMN